MGYEVHITRADDWCENDTHRISMQEWMEYVDADEELTIDPDNGPGFVIRSAHPTEPEAWLSWNHGIISTKAPDDLLLKKMIAVAEQFEARVQGDEGELYNTNNLREPLTSEVHTHWWKSVSLIGSFISAICLPQGLLLAYFVWNDFSLGDSIDVVLFRFLVFVMCVGLPTLTISSICALNDVAFHKDKRRLSLYVLILNVFMAVIYWGRLS